MDKILQSVTSFVDISNEAKDAESDSEREKTRGTNEVSGASMTKGTAVRLIDDACFNVGGTGTSLFSDTPEMVRSSIYKRCHIY